MAAADTARLIASLELDNRKFLAASDKAVGSLSKIQGRLGAVSGFVNRNLGAALDRAASSGVHALVGAVQGGIDALSQLEDATGAVDGAIAQMGLTGQVTSGQVATWANEIEKNVQAAFDDKAITRNAAVLIRYGRITSSNLHPALQVMTDLAAKTGDVDSAASLLAKALADPAKAAGKLSRAGVVLTKQQQDQIKALIKSGKLGAAQKVILDSLATSTKNAARDSAGPWRDMQNQLRDTTEDAQKLLAQGFQPVLEKIGGKLQQALADPKTMQAIKDFGQAAADALDKVATFIEGIPWDKVSSGLSTAAGFAKTLIGAFTSMPPQAQATILALVGLNKLSGGAVTGIIGDLGKGLIKGVLGMTAGVVNLKAGVVNGAGGVGAGGVPGGGSSKLTKALAAASIVGDIVGVVATQQQIAQQSSDQAAGIKASLDAGIKVKTPAELQTALNGVNQGINQLQANPLLVLVQGSALDQLKAMRDELTNALGKRPTAGSTSFRAGERDISKVPKADPALISKTDLVSDKVDRLRPPLTDVKRTVEAAKAAQVQAIRDTGSTTGTNIRGTTGAVQSAQSAITAAIHASRPIITTTVDVSVTASGIQKSTTTSSSYGEQNGSAGGSGGHSGAGKIPT